MKILLLFLGVRIPLCSAMNGEAFCTFNASCFFMAHLLLPFSSVRESKKRWRFCTTVATQPRLLHYLQQFIKTEKRKGSGAPPWVSALNKFFGGKINRVFCSHFSPSIEVSKIRSLKCAFSFSFLSFSRCVCTHPEAYSSLNFSLLF